MSIFGGSLAYYVTNKRAEEYLDPRNLPRDVAGTDIIKQNEQYKQFMGHYKTGRPGHYYGRDVIIEGAMPIAQFVLMPAIYGGELNWYMNDAKFDHVMGLYPMWDWRKQ